MFLARGIDRTPLFMEWVEVVKWLSSLKPGEVSVFGVLLAVAFLYLFGLHKEFHVWGGTHKIVKEQLATAIKERDAEREARLKLQIEFDKKTDDEVTARLELVSLRKEREMSAWSRPPTPEGPR
jgi:hypothetical protein